MKKSLLILTALVLSIAMMAEKYTIVFNSNENGDGSATDKLNALVLTATNNCVESIRYASKVARAKPGFGIKGGTASVKGELVLGLDDTYPITTMTVYAACFDNATDLKKTYGINIYDHNIQWEAEHKTEIYPYHLTINANVDSISIASVEDKNNRWYVQKIEFEAEEPHPTRAIIETQYPIMDFGGAKWESKDEPLEDADLRPQTQSFARTIGCSYLR